MIQLLTLTFMAYDIMCRDINRFSEWDRAVYIYIAVMIDTHCIVEKFQGQ